MPAPRADLKVCATLQERPLRHPRFELVRQDVVEPLAMEVDQIYHLACPAAPGHYQFNPIKTMKTSVMGAINGAIVAYGRQWTPRSLRGKFAARKHGT
jgi:nucleoside-diphosphate-sugar epimerase